MEEQDKKSISRREALKAIAAVTGVAVLSSVRNDWETPLVQVGGLPAHAQASRRLANLIVVNSPGSGRTIVTVLPSNSPINSTETRLLGDGESTTFILEPGNYDVTAEGECPSSESVELDPGETEEVVVGCVNNGPV